MLTRLLHENHYTQQIIWTFGLDKAKAVANKFNAKHPNQACVYIDTGSANVIDETLLEGLVSLTNTSRFYIYAHGDPGCDSISPVLKVADAPVNYRDIARMIATHATDSSLRNPQPPYCRISLVCCHAGKSTSDDVDNSFANLLHQALLAQGIYCGVVARTHTMLMNSQGKWTVSHQHTDDEVKCLVASYQDLHWFWGWRQRERTSGQLKRMISPKGPGIKRLFSINQSGEQCCQDAYLQKWRAAAEQFIVSQRQENTHELERLQPLQDNSNEEIVAMLREIQQQMARTCLSFFFAQDLNTNLLVKLIEQGELFCQLPNEIQVL